ncbi:MAG TPA: hypothetical protein VI911_10920 [Patescibacteria group bacterium]|nr:hypothetical protein [Patescibacteria group bacterium]
MTNIELTKITNTGYTNMIDNKLHLIKIRITEGYYNEVQVIDLVVGSIIDIIA